VREGGREGFASCREITDSDGPPLRTGGSCRGLLRRVFRASARCRDPASISRLSDRPASGDAEPSASSAVAQRPGRRSSRRMVAMPSSALAARPRLSFRPPPGRGRARSRSSRATAWNFVRTAGVTQAAPGSRLDLRAVSRAPRESPRWGTLAASAGVRERRLACLVSHRLLLWNAGARWTAPCRKSAAGRGTSRGTGPGTSNAEPACGSQGSTQQALTSVSRGPGSAGGGGLVTTAREVAVTRRLGSLGTTHVNACAGA